MATPWGTKPRTRQASSCKLSGFVGSGKEFCLADVPTVRAVIRRGLLLREQKAGEGVDIRNYPDKELAKDLAPLIVAQWQKASVKFEHPEIVTLKQVAAKVEIIWGKVLEVSRGRGKKKDKEQIAAMLDKLLDIVHCQCQILFCGEQESECANPSLCKVKAHTKCSCNKAEKVPVLELEWLRIQRDKIGEKGGMQMASAGHTFSKKLLKTEANKAKKDEAKQKREAKVRCQEEELQEREKEELLQRQEEEDQDIEMEENILHNEPFLPLTKTKEQEKDAAVLVYHLLEERLGSGKGHQKEPHASSQYCCREHEVNMHTD